MTRKQALERMSAPVIAWLIDQGYVQDMGGFFHLRPHYDMRYAYHNALVSVPLKPRSAEHLLEDVARPLRLP